MSPKTPIATHAPAASSRSAALPTRAALVACAGLLVGITACSGSSPADTTASVTAPPGAVDAVAPPPTTAGAANSTAPVAAGTSELAAGTAEVAAGTTAQAAGGIAPGGTQVIAFDPVNFGRGSGAYTPPDTLGTCEASEVVPRPNAYACTNDAGAHHDPCFVIASFNYTESSGSQLGCSPDPIMGSWGAIVRHNGALPATPATAMDPVIFFVSLGTAYPGCERIEPKRPLGDETVSFQCLAPGAVLVDDIDTGVSPYTAQYVTTDSAGTAITSGPDETPVVTAWVW